MTIITKFVMDDIDISDLPAIIKAFNKLSSTDSIIYGHIQHS